MIDQNINKDQCSNMPLDKNDLPQFLSDALNAANQGQLEKASEIIDSNIDKLQNLNPQKPSDLCAMSVLAMVLSHTNQVQKAEQLFRDILQTGDYDFAYTGLLSILQKKNCVWQTMDHANKALVAYPDNPVFMHILAESNIQAGQTKKGITLFEKALEIFPHDQNIRSSYLLYLHRLCDIDPKFIFDEHKKWQDSILPAVKIDHTHTNDPDSHRPIRIGYISPDFREHSVANFFEPILNAHDRKNFNIFGYGNVEKTDNVTERFISAFDHYTDIFTADDSKVFQMIRQDKIDILIDLAGHTHNNRLSLFALKPAPIAITYLGYPDTTGLQAIDYRITDPLADLPEYQPLYTEELTFLKNGFLCYKLPDSIPPVGPLPAKENNFITFGSFNINCKINPFIMQLWANILKQNKNFRLLLKSPRFKDQPIKDHYIDQFKNLGIDPSRIEIVGWLPADEHLALYNKIDIALDTFPYNGTTTICQALSMGVPVISLTGNNHASRVGLSILTRLGLDFFADPEPDQYVKKAVALASNLDALEKIRYSMRQRMLQSPLCDAGSFTRSLEEAYRKMWKKWCAKKADLLPA